MSAIDTTFHWDKNPTAINGLVTTYCSKRGSDVSGDGTAQGKIKRLDSIVFRLINSLGVLVSQTGSNYQNLTYRTSADEMNQPVPLVTADAELNLAGDGYNTDGFIYISQSQPFPMTIIAIIPQLVTYDKG